AHAVGDLWSWDITELRGPRPQDRYKLYLAIDVFSRYPVAWRMELDPVSRTVRVGCSGHL
ncbi:integrase catalytic domain-containing protein, partial [Rhodococcoides kroppenstedtii]|uniref:integrase catalytic domain-containing protein n=1 Tax=Rhodococcoides kroppenstedtii TaxID=293050 RepID=UPI001F1087F0